MSMLKALIVATRALSVCDSVKPLFGLGHG